METSSGTAALEADWQANTVGVTFYSDNTQIGTGTCQYDGTLTLPENNPEKTGYTFNGWKVRAAAPAQAICPDIPNEDCDDTPGCRTHDENGDGCYYDISSCSEAQTEEICNNGMTCGSECRWVNGQCQKGGWHWPCSEW